MVEWKENPRGGFERISFMILTCSHLTKSFGANEIFRDVSFTVEDREKVAIVGANGAGKSTLLKIIAGQLSCDAGETFFAKGAKAGYLAQQGAVSGNRTVYAELQETRADLLRLEARIRETESAMRRLTGDALSQALELYNRLNVEFENQNGYQYESEVTGILKGLGFSPDEFQKPVDALSGGQKTRVALGKLLLQRPDILLLDEPTNHLDLNAVAWLEAYLQNYGGAVVVVAHDRYFLNKIVSKVVEIENGRASAYLGNYHDYAQKKAQAREAMWRAYQNQQQEIRRQEEVIHKLRSFNREKSVRRAQSREKLLEKVTRVEKPADAPGEMRLRFDPPAMSGNDVLTVEHLGKSYGSLRLFSDLNFLIRRGEKVAIIGDNGTGKTTLLKIINQAETPDCGRVSLGSNVRIGYYDQEHNILHMEKTLFAELSDAYPKMTNTQIRSTLASFLFTGDDVFKKIGDLSGGARGRVSMAKRMLSDANFLSLDEPTNHQDITSKEVLEQAIRAYTGTVLYVSHDRYFINETCTRILELAGQDLCNYIGNYDDYAEKKGLGETAAPAGRGAALFGGAVSQDAQKKAETSDGARAWMQKKEEQQRLRKRKNDLKKTEDEIQTLETRNQEIDALLATPEVYRDPAACMELNKEKTGIAASLETLYETWEALAE